MLVYSRSDLQSVDDIEALLMVQEVQFEKFKQELATPAVSANIAHAGASSSSTNSVEAE
ncbi:retrovirus-related pol polyprotein from transposon TNT 1-94, partial [Trifolium medium]|nr:retrovirus-related pol polyprotein from transposon TNT 1-94 [Trifolium medium]